MRKNICVCPNLKLYYWSIPKAGSTSITQKLFEIDDPHYVNIKHMGDKFKAFTVVRNPIERFISGYKDLCLVRPHIWKNKTFPFGIEMEKIVDNPDIEQLINLVENFEPTKLDPHLRSQTLNLEEQQNRFVKYKLETVCEDPTILHPDIKELPIENTTGHISKVRLNRSQIERLETVFLEDFELWWDAL